MAEGSLASIIVEITADASDFLSELKKASDGAKSFAETGAVIAAAGGAVVTAFGAMTEAASTFGTTIFQMSQMTGLTADTLSGLSLAAKSAGGDLDSVSTGLRKLATDANNAANGNKAAADLFDRLGISATNADGSVKSLSDLLPEAADALSGVDNSTTRAADAVALFGRSGMNLLPVLASGGAGLQEWIQKAKDTGTYVSDSMAQQDKAFQLAQHEVEASLEGIALAIGQIFIPAMTDAANYVAGLIQPIHDWINAHADLVESIGEVAVALVAGGTLMVGIGGLLAAMPLITIAIEAVTAGFTAMLAVVPGVGIAIGVVAAAFIAWNAAQWTIDTLNLRDAFSSAWDSVKNLAASFADLVATDFEFLVSKISDVASSFKGVNDAATPATDKVKEFISWWANTTLANVKAETDDLAAGLQILANALGSADQQLQQFQNDQIANIQAQQNWGAQLENNVQAHDGLASAIQLVADKLSAAKTPYDLLTKSQQALYDQITGESKAQTDLIATIQAATDAHVSQQQIYAALGPKIEDLVSKYNDEGIAIPPLIQKLHDMNQAHQDEIMWRETLAQLVRDSKTNIDNETASLSHYLDVVRAGKTDQEALVNNTNTLDLDVLSLTDGEKDATIAQQDFNAAIQAGIQPALDLATQMGDMNEIVGIFVDNMNAHIGFLTQFGLATEDISTKWNTLKGILGQPMTPPPVDVGPIDSSLKQLGDYAQSIVDGFSTGWNTAINKIPSNLGKAFADALVGAKSWSSAMIDVAKSAAEGMLSALMTGLMSPLTSALKSLGSTISGALTSALGGGGGGAAGAAEDAAGGAGAGGLFGGAGGAIAGFMTNPLTIGIGAALAGGFALYEAFKSNTHLVANQFVSQYQNPFQSNLEDIVNQFNDARANGGLTVSQATDTLDNVKTLIGNFESTISDWQQKGGDNAIVANQAQQTMNALFGQNFSDLITSMQTNIDQRQGVIDDPVTAATTDNTTATNTLTDSTNTLINSTNTLTTAFQTFSQKGNTSGLLDPNTHQPVASMGGNKPNASPAATTTGSGATNTATMNAGATNTAAAAINGTAFNTPNGTIYLSAQQISDLQNSGGAYSLTSGYQYLVPNATLGVEPSNPSMQVYYSPGAIAAMSAADKHAAGIPGYAAGGPTKAGLSMLHDDEYVVPKGGALVKGGGNNYHFSPTVQALDMTGAEAAMGRIIDKFVDGIEQGKGRNATARLAKVLGV